MNVNLNKDNEKSYVSQSNNNNLRKRLGRKLDISQQVISF